MKILSDEQVKYLAEEPDSEEDSTVQEIEWRDPVKQLGWAKVEHILTLDQSLSDGAYRTYVLLHSYWQQKLTTWPLIKTLAKARGTSVPTLSRHLAELAEKGLITRNRRWGRSSLTFLEDLPAEYTEAAIKVLTERAQNKSKTSDKTYQKRYDTDIKNDMYKKNQEEEPLNKNHLIPTNGANMQAQNLPPSITSSPPKEKKGAFEPRTPLAKEMQELSRRGKGGCAYWPGFESAHERDKWEQMEKEFEPEDIRGAIRWATKAKLFPLKVIPARVMSAVYNRRKQKREVKPKAQAATMADVKRNNPEFYGGFDEADSGDFF